MKEILSTTYIMSDILLIITLLVLRLVLRLLMLLQLRIFSVSIFFLC